MIFVTQYNFYWFLIGYVVAAYLIAWAVDWIWFRYVDWYIARATRERHTDDQGRLAAKGPARRRHSLPRTGRAIGGISAPRRVI